MAKEEFLNLDDADPNQNELVITLKGRQHKMKHPTVADFIANVKAVESRPENMTLVEETEFTVDMLCRSFPTVQKEDFMQLDMAKLSKLLEMVRKVTNDGQIEEEAGEGGSPTAAG